MTMELFYLIENIVGKQLTQRKILLSKISTHGHV